MNKYVGNNYDCFKNICTLESLLHIFDDVDIQLWLVYSSAFIRRILLEKKKIFIN